MRNIPSHRGCPVANDVLRNGSAAREGHPITFLGELPASKAVDMECGKTDTKCKADIAGRGSQNPQGLKLGSPHETDYKAR